MWNQRGQSLVQVMISSAIMLIVIMAMVSTQVMQSRETRGLTERLASNDLTRVLTGTLSTTACNLMFAKSGNVESGNLTFDTTAVTFPFDIFLKSIPQTAKLDLISTSNPIASSLSSTLSILTTGGIQLQVTGPVSANLILNFDQSKLVRQMRNLSFPIALTSTLSGPSNQTETITGCQIATPGTRPSMFQDWPNAIICDTSIGEREYLWLGVNYSAAQSPQDILYFGFNTRYVVFDRVNGNRTGDVGFNGSNTNCFSIAQIKAENRAFW